jgi:hypothetical protein
MKAVINEKETPVKKENTRIWVKLTKKWKNNLSFYELLTKPA